MLWQSDKTYPYLARHQSSMEYNLANSSTMLFSFVQSVHFISFIGGIFYISTPFLISLAYYANISNIFYSIPFMLFFIHLVLKNFNKKNVLFYILYSFFIIGSSNIYVFIIYPPVLFLYSIIIAYKYCDLRFLNSLKKTLIIVFLFLLSGSYVIVPLFYNIYTMSSASIPILNVLIMAFIYLIMEYFSSNRLKTILYSLVASIIILFVIISFSFFSDISKISLLSLNYNFAYKTSQTNIISIFLYVVLSLLTDRTIKATILMDVPFLQVIWSILTISFFNCLYLYFSKTIVSLSIII